MHFAAGPWFTVQSTDPERFHPMGQVWWSDGVSDGPAVLWMRAALHPNPTSDKT